MNVDGMRWHDKTTHHGEPATRQSAKGEQMTESEARRFTWYAIRAGMLVVLIFSVVWVLFILFCTQVWFR